MRRCALDYLRGEEIVSEYRVSALRAGTDPMKVAMLVLNSRAERQERLRRTAALPELSHYTTADTREAMAHA